MDGSSNAPALHIFAEMPLSPEPDFFHNPQFLIFSSFPQGVPPLPPSPIYIKIFMAIRLIVLFFFWDQQRGYLTKPRPLF